MAPDLNSVPPSPRPLASSPRATEASRRASQPMLPPPIPLSSPALNILPSNQNAVNSSSQISAMSAANSSAVAVDNTGVGSGPGPLRHPRPLTAADLHLQLEKEQEAVVNRLTRELTLLRAAQNASVVSNSSSTSAGFPDTGDHNANHMLSGPSHPAPSHRHHRTSSSTSTRSTTPGTAASVSTAGWTTGAVAGSMASVFTPSSTSERARGSIPRHDSIPQSASSMSRQNSTTSSRRSGASSPAPPLSNQHADYFPTGRAQRPSFSLHRDPSGNQVSASGIMEPERQNSSTSLTSVQTGPRYEEAVYHRHELEGVKRENEALRHRIRELERTLRERRQSDASRTRSDSVSTTASVTASMRDSIGGLGRGREREKENESADEMVRVGESARSGGFR